MDFTQFPEQEDEERFPKEASEMTPEPLDMEPPVEETPFVPDGAEEEISAVEVPIPDTVANPEELPSDTELSDTEEAPVIEEPFLFEEDTAAKGAAFMERIPDVDDVPEEIPDGLLERELLETPEVSHELTPDEEAMDFHGMLEHGEEEPPFDMSILDDPEFAMPTPPEPAEDVNDQEYRDNGKDFDAIYGAPPAEEAASTPPRPPRKGRPKRKKGEGLFGIPNMLVTVVWLALIVAIGVTLGRMLWVCAADVLAFGREDKAVTITIYEADTMEDIVEKLYNNGLIRYKSLFNLYADISDAEEDIKPGIYDLNTRYDYHALVNFMSPSSSREVVEGLLIPEGYSCQQIFKLLEENKVCTVQDIAAYAADGELGDYWFLEGVERGTENCLEGFLFPDTYDFYKNSTPREVLTKLLDNFEVKFDEDMRAQIETLNEKVTGGGYTVREVTIVASLIEKESAGSEESPAIAGVIYNRLFNWEYPAYLNIDAAIVYAQGGEAEHIDTGLDSPYNTYTNIGLTPTPIANPGLSSLKAALNPESHNYYYYVLNPSTGMHQFSTTEAEHNAYVAEFYG